MARGRVEYIRVPLTPGRKAQLQRRADEEHRTLGQMAAIMVIDDLPEEVQYGTWPEGPWRTPILIPPGG